MSTTMAVLASLAVVLTMLILYGMLHTPHAAVADLGLIDWVESQDADVVCAKTKVKADNQWGVLVDGKIAAYGSTWREAVTRAKSLKKVPS